MGDNCNCIISLKERKGERGRERERERGWVHGTSVHAEWPKRRGIKFIVECKLFHFFCAFRVHLTGALKFRFRAKRRATFAFMIILAAETFGRRSHIHTMAQIKPALCEIKAVPSNKYSSNSISNVKSAIFFRRNEYIENFRRLPSALHLPRKYNFPQILCGTYQVHIHSASKLKTAIFIHVHRTREGSGRFHEKHTSSVGWGSIGNSFQWFRNVRTLQPTLYPTPLPICQPFSYHNQLKFPADKYKCQEERNAWLVAN